MSLKTALIRTYALGEARTHKIRGPPNLPSHRGRLGSDIYVYNNIIRAKLGWIKIRLVKVGDNAETAVHTTEMSFILKCLELWRIGCPGQKYGNTYRGNIKSIESVPGTCIFRQPNFVFLMVFRIFLLIGLEHLSIFVSARTPSVVQQ